MRRSWGERRGYPLVFVLAAQAFHNARRQSGIYQRLAGGHAAYGRDQFWAADLLEQIAAGTCEYR